MSPIPKTRTLRKSWKKINILENDDFKGDKNVLEFMNKAKDRANIGMVMENQMYNEIKKLHLSISSLQEKSLFLQLKLDEESMKWRELSSWEYPN